MGKMRGKVKVILSRTAGGQKKSSLLPLILSLLFVVFLVSCDLFTDPKVDLYQAISDDVDWANAPKLTVRIDYPSIWGTSAPPQGDITPAKDLRKGFEFSVDFIPGSMYALMSWQAYLTSDLQAVSGQQGQTGNWLEDPTIIAEEGIESLGPSDVTLPAVTADNARGGTYKFTVYTTEPVTIVPWCDPQLRITRTEPRNNPNGTPYSKASDIVIYFNGALNDKTVRFANSKDDKGIWITAASGNDTFTNKDKNWYITPEYAAVGGFFTVTMNTGADLPPSDSLMTVTVKGIESAQGDSMDAAGYSFSWRTSSKANVMIISYNATYNDNDKKIYVTYVQQDAAYEKMYYRLNGGANVEFNGTIEKVPDIDVSGVREGVGVSNIAEYEIFIELHAEGSMEYRERFKIWNFPGMSVSKTNQAVEIRTPDQLAAMKNNLSGQYVLANDIAVSTAWTPVGTSAAPFTGKFYGNGRTIAFNDGSSIGGTDNIKGLFSYTNGALIRDLTFEYNVVAPIGVSVDSFIGGVAGYLKNTVVRNVITSGGTLSVSITSTGAVYLGGIAGCVENSFIGNCRAGLNVNLTSNGTGAGNIGAVAGYTNGGSGGNITINIAPPGKAADNKTVSKLALEGVTVAANVSADKQSFSGQITIGGAVGQSKQNTMSDITYTDGIVSFSSSYDSDNYCGGIVGNSVLTSIVGSSFLGNIIIGTSDNPINGLTYLGGLAGYNEINDIGEYYINNNRMCGSIEFNGSTITVGGFFGYANHWNDGNDDLGTITVTNCFFEDGSITVNSVSTTRAGGFSGIFNGKHTLNNCGVLAGTVTVETTQNVSAGGFTCEFVGTISNCFSRMDVITKSLSQSQVGGFVSFLGDNSKISACYANGTVSSTINTGDSAYIGGLVGNCQGVIENSYALGNVLADISGSNGYIFAGGLVGSYSNNNEIITNCFSTGRVSSQAALSTYSEVYSGGIAGKIYGGTITNTAALSMGVTVRGGTKSAGRIYGAHQTGVLASSAKNYALNSMTVKEGTYNSLTPTPVILNEGLNAKDGKGTASSTFLSQTFWSGTLGFSDTVWDFSRVAIEGYPRLKNVGGQ